MSAMNHQDARELLALAALDALSPEDAAAVEAHIAWCADCRKELAELRDVAARVGSSIPLKPMDPERKERVMARLQRRVAHSKENAVARIARAEAGPAAGGALRIARGGARARVARGLVHGSRAGRNEGGSSTRGRRFGVPSPQFQDR